MSQELGTIVDELRRELRADSQFRKLTPEDQVWLVQSIAAGNYGTLAQLADALKGRSGAEFGKSALSEFKQRVNSRLLKLEGHKQARKELADRLLRAGNKASETVDLVRRILPGITESVATMLGDQTLDLVMKGADPEALNPTLKMFLEAAKGARESLGEARKSDEAKTDRERFELERHQQQVKSCELFVKWCEDERARKILESPRSNAERIKALGELFYADLWQPATPASANG